MVQLVRGFRGKLSDHMQTEQEIVIRMEVSGGGVYDVCCIGTDAQDKLTNERYVIFYNQTASPEEAVRSRVQGEATEFSVRPALLPSEIGRLRFAVCIEGSSTMGQIEAFDLTVCQNGTPLMKLHLNGSDFNRERAVIAAELYRKDEWRIGIPASGWEAGIRELFRSVGSKLDALDDIAAPAPVPVRELVPTPPPTPVPPYVPEQPSPAPQRPAKVELRKGQKVSLAKQESGSLGEILINLNWSQPERKDLLGLFSNAIDLDLECLYELTDGSKGAVQAIGRKFGSLQNRPYIALDGDDRSGASSEGENLRINGERIAQIRRILVYTSIYEGAVNWSEAKGIATVKCPGNPEIIVRLDEYHPSRKICAVALLENNGNGGFSVEKLVQYFESKPLMDQTYHWGLQWSYGKK